MAVFSVCFIFHFLVLNFVAGDWLLEQGETRKKQFSASIPGHILARVRELAALNNQIIPAPNVGTSTSRSGRTVHRR